MFQVASVDDGHITWVNGNEVTHAVRSQDGMSLSAWARLDVRRQVCEGCHDHDRDDHGAAKEGNIWITVHLQPPSDQKLAEGLCKPLPSLYIM